MSSVSAQVDRGHVFVHVGDARAFGADATRIAQALAWMSPAERERYARFRHDRDRVMFGLGREMARVLVAAAMQLDPRDWSWREGPHGRPEIAEPATDVTFNVSHSAGLVVCVIARGRLVGVDVEDLTRRPPDPEIVPRYCSPDETADVRAQGDQWRDRFLTYWTLKESYLKARGLGIAVHLSDISFTLDGHAGARIGFRESLTGTDDRWTFHRISLAPHHLAAVAIEASDAVPAEVTVFPYEPNATTLRN